MNEHLSYGTSKSINGLKLGRGAATTFPDAGTETGTSPFIIYKKADRPVQWSTLLQDLPPALPPLHGWSPPAFANTSGSAEHFFTTVAHKLKSKLQANS